MNVPLFDKALASVMYLDVSLCQIVSDLTVLALSISLSLSIYWLESCGG